MHLLLAHLDLNLLYFLLSNYLQGHDDLKFHLNHRFVASLLIEPRTLF